MVEYVEIKVPSKNCGFDAEHSFISDLVNINGSIPVLDMQNQDEVNMWLLAFIVHFVQRKPGSVFKNVSKKFLNNYRDSLSNILGLDFEKLIS